MKSGKFKKFIMGKTFDRERMLRVLIISLAGIGLIYERSVHFNVISVPSLESVMFVLLAVAVGFYVVYCDHLNSKLIKELSKKTKSIEELSKELQELQKKSEQLIKHT